MSWFVLVPAAWFGIALALGLLVGRCLHVEGIGRTAAPALAEGAAAPAAPEPTADDDSHVAVAVGADHALAPSV
jgi:hypothetical protein